MTEVSPEQNESILELMKRFRRGDAGAAGQLVEELYPDLKRLAALKMSRERCAHSWHATLLVHELYLELTRLKGFPLWEQSDVVDADREKNTFLKLAGLMMQRRLIDHARPKLRKLPSLRIDLPENSDKLTVGKGPELDELLYIDGLLHRLEEIDPKFRTVVEGRVFLGLTLAEIALQLDCSERTAAAYWSYTRQWLAEELDHGCRTE